jgi:hypothetical protein
MKFCSTASNYLNSFPSAGLQPVVTTGSESWQEDYNTVSSLDLGSERISDAHGSFVWLPSTTSSITSTESQENYSAALKDALTAVLTIEEAAKYIKSVLLGPCPTIGNFNNSLIEDAREDSTLVTHGSPWRFFIKTLKNLTDLNLGWPALL